MKTILITDKNIKSKKFDIVIDIRSLNNFLIDEIIKNVYDGNAKFPERDRSILNKVKAESKVYLDIHNKIRLLLTFSVLWEYGFDIYLILSSIDSAERIAKDTIWNLHFTKTKET